MKQAGMGRFLIATSAVAFATLFSVGWSEQHGISLSVDSAQARRLYVSPYGHGPFRADLSGLSWDAVRAYYVGGPWCGAGGPTGYGAAAGAPGLVPGAATAAGLTMRSATALVARPAVLSKVGTASITYVSRQPKRRLERAAFFQLERDVHLLRRRVWPISAQAARPDKHLR